MTRSWSACRRAAIIASGPIISLMDMATSMAIWVKLGRFRHQATLDLRVDYLRPATPGQTIVGRGECYGVTRSVGFVRGLAHDGDPADPVAHVTGHLHVHRLTHHPDGGASRRGSAESVGSSPSDGPRRCCERTGRPRRSSEGRIAVIPPGNR